MGLSTPHDPKLFRCETFQPARTEIDLFSFDTFQRGHKLGFIPNSHAQRARLFQLAAGIASGDDTIRFLGDRAADLRAE